MENKNLETMSKVSLCEEQVLAVILDSEEHPDLRKAMETVNERFSKQWKPQTVSTFLSRLVKKKVLSMYRKGRYCYYMPEIQKEDYIKMSLLHIANTFLDGDLSKLQEVLDDLQDNPKSETK